jgi:hypothetical protein
MSVITSRNVLLTAALTALVGGTAALANEPILPGPNHIVLGNPNVAQCAAGFTAKPATINAANPYGQAYTCTGPVIVCSPRFTAQPSVAGTIPGGPGQFGQTIYGSPVTIKSGRMVYTCAEPSPPPQ